MPETATDAINFLGDGGRSRRNPISAASGTAARGVAANVGFVNAFPMAKAAAATARANATTDRPMRIRLNSADRGVMSLMLATRTARGRNCRDPESQPSRGPLCLSVAPRNYTGVSIQMEWFSLGGLPKGTDTRKCVAVLVDEFGWTYQESKGGHSHPVGYLMCGERSTDGCRMSVNGTGNNTGRKLWTVARRCTHGYRPTRNKW